jgi:metalloendopeptidase OMA1, mitochondrial
MRLSIFARNQARLRAMSVASAAWCGVLCCASFIGLPSCSVNPYTQRSQLVMTPPAYERAIGMAAYRTKINDPAVVLDRDPFTRLAAQRILARLIAAAERSPYADMARSFDWEMAVIDDEGARNAVAYPGGKLVIYTGVFPIARHETGLAVVLAHEMAHALARHSAEQLTYDALRTTHQKHTVLPFSRQHELEADYIGLLLTAQAGYEPSESVHMWERMKQSGDESPPEWLSTHPSYDRRIAALQTHLHEARVLYDHSRRAVTELPAPNP